MMTAGMPGALPAWLLPPSAHAPKLRHSTYSKGAVPAPKKKVNITPSTGAGLVPSSTTKQAHHAAKKLRQGVPGRFQQKDVNQASAAPEGPESPALSYAADELAAGLSMMDAVAASQHKRSPGEKGSQLLGVGQSRRLLKLSSQAHRPRKRFQSFENVSASQRCGHCKTCLKPSTKKACLTRRGEMESLLAIVPSDA